MGLLRDHLVGEANGHPVEFEAFLNGLACGCALFVDGRRVDKVDRFGPWPTSFSLRHVVAEPGPPVTIRVDVTQRLGTSAALFVNGVERPFTRRA